MNKKLLSQHNIFVSQIVFKDSSASKDMLFFFSWCFVFLLCIYLRICSSIIFVLSEMKRVIHCFTANKSFVFAIFKIFIYNVFIFISSYHTYIWTLDTIFLVSDVLKMLIAAFSIKIMIKLQIFKRYLIIFSKNSYSYGN